MMIPDTTNRSNAQEIMDDLGMEGELLASSLKKLDWINFWLGGNGVTIDGVELLLQTQTIDRALTVVDVGCGSGDSLRRLANYFRKKDIQAKFIGIDANDFTIQYARKHSTSYPEISYLVAMVPSEEYKSLGYDILTATLFMHHLTDEEIVSLLGESAQKAKMGIVINDLHRSRWAYFLYSLLSLFFTNPMVVQDGKISILRGFKRKDFERYTRNLPIKQSMVKWRWAFRYQWILFSKQN
ncbi:MAG TPA: methyltransferase domain-containing protein [Saprospiraceae bacterium]|nr:methyltransferase domain-containing protein [Saprospiraceae bacterium]HPN69395.1 methyltransferase domain-containing protein [Saprospiraceae bacterium]